MTTNTDGEADAIDEKEGLWYYINVVCNLCMDAGVTDIVLWVLFRWCLNPKFLEVLKYPKKLRIGVNASIWKSKFVDFTNNL